MLTPMIQLWWRDNTSRENLLKVNRPCHFFFDSRWVKTMRAKHTQTYWHFAPSVLGWGTTTMLNPPRYVVFGLWELVGVPRYSLPDWVLSPQSQFLYHSSNLRNNWGCIIMWRRQWLLKRPQTVKAKQHRGGTVQCSTDSIKVSISPLILETGREPQQRAFRLKTPKSAIKSCALRPIGCVWKLHSNPDNIMANW